MELNQVISDAIHDILPAAEVVKIPVADGGEGWVDALMPVLGGERITCWVEDPLGNPVQASYAWVEETKTAVIEMAAASGISLIPWKEGAAYVFARQKGASEEQVALLDEGLRHLADKIQKQYGVDLQDCPGSGAAGGLGGGCYLFLHAPLLSGISMLKRILHFDETIQDADLIITGEGKMDVQTEQGKLLWGILESAGKYHVPVVAITGNCAEQSGKMEENPLLATFPIHPAPVSLSDAMQPDYARLQVNRTIHSVIKLISFGKKLARDGYIC